MEMKKIIRNCLAICAFITILVACQQITESKLENDYFEYDTENNQYIVHTKNFAKLIVNLPDGEYKIKVIGSLSEDDAREFYENASEFTKNIQIHLDLSEMGTLIHAVHKDYKYILINFISETCPKYIFSVTTPIDSEVSVRFEDCTNLSSIKVPDEAKALNCFFYNCTNLKEVTIPEGVEVIGIAAFKECTALEKISIPNTLTEIKEEAFLGCTNLKKIELPESITKIGDQAFYNCTSLTSITIPNTINEFGGWIFAGCSTLKSVTLHDGVSKIADGLLGGCTNLEEIQIPDSILEIGRSAFYNCTSLKTLNIPFGVAKIDHHAFQKCSNIKTLSIPKSVTEMGEEVFNECTSLEEISITGEASLSFEGCENLSKIIFLEGTTTIGENTCANLSKLKEIHIPNSVIEIGSGAFSGCTSIENIIIPNSVIEIGSGAFSRCTSLENITIPDSVSEMKGYTFNECTNLREISIPAELEFYASDFIGCINLTKIKGSNKYSISNGMILRDNTTLILWPSASGNVTIPDYITDISRDSFWNCNNLTGIEYTRVWFELPFSVKDCPNLTTITLPNDFDRLRQDIHSTFFKQIKTINYKGSEEEWNRIRLRETFHDGSFYTNSFASYIAYIGATVNFNYISE